MLYQFLNNCQPHPVCLDLIAWAQRLKQFKDAAVILCRNTRAIVYHGKFDMGAQIFDRMGARVEISTEDASNFRQNLVTILCEERLALAIYRPEAFVKGDFSDQITDLTS